MDIQSKNDKKAEDVKQITLALMAGKKAVGEINYDDIYEKQALEAAIAEKPSLLAGVGKLDKFGKKILLDAVSKKYSNFIYLSEPQYFDEIAQIYLLKRFEDTSEKWKGDKFRLKQSMDNKLVLTLNYVSHKGEEVYYFDRDLRIPASLLTNMRVSVKFNDACKFFGFLDVKVASVNLPDALEALLDLINTEYRRVLQDFIDSKQIGFYKLSAEYGELKEALADALNLKLSKYGAEISDVNIQSISFADNMYESITEQFYALQIERMKKEMENDIAGLSLENYKKKAEIHEKYPNFPVTLTEAEKDLALKRYLVRMEKYSEERLQLDKESVSERTENAAPAEELVKTAEPVVIETPPEPGKNKRLIALCAITGVLVFISLLVMIASVPTGLVLAIVFAAAGIATFFIKKNYFIRSGKLTEISVSKPDSAADSAADSAGDGKTNENK